MTRVTQQHVDARRDSILTAAARLFARKGIAGATMADIATEADLSAGAIYRYFGSKEELLHAVFDEAALRNREKFQREAEAASSPLEALQRIGHQIWIENDDRDELICEVQMALSAARNPEDLGIDLSENRRVVLELLEDMVRKAQAAGEIDPAIDPKTLAVILQACTGGIQMLKMDENQDINVEAAFELFVQMVVGLRLSDDQRTGR